MKTEKQCSGCGEVKTLANFPNRQDKPDGKSPRCKRCNRAGHYRRRYGITIEEYEEKYEELEGICPLCTTFYITLAVDHDHKTGEFRGLLCISCNRVLGYFENPEWTQRATEYLS